MGSINVVSRRGNRVMPHFQSAQLASARPALPIEREQPAPEGRRTFAIGEIARDFGVTLRALRFYEAKGMLKPRRRGTTRFYTLGDRERLATILKGKELGFSLRDIREMLAEGANPAGDAPLPLSDLKVSDQIATLETQKAAIEHALARLRTYTARMGETERAERAPAARRA
jgi:DNA-binding transcriptional MerR regulator